MTIDVTVLNKPYQEPKEFFGYRILITDDPHPSEGMSVENFKLLVRKALNTWDDAPQELKELGDMLDHGKILQDYSGNKSMAAVSSGDIGSDRYPGIADDKLPICEYCGGRGEAHYHSCPARYKTIMKDSADPAPADDTAAASPETPV